jgi:hypothetical protein
MLLTMIRCSASVMHLQVGSYSLEFRALSYALGDPTYACIADKMQLHIVGNASTPWHLGQSLYHHTPIYTAFDNVDGSGQFEGTVSFGSGSDSFYEYLLKSHLIAPRDSPQLYVQLYRRLVTQLNFEFPPPPSPRADIENCNTRVRYEQLADDAAAPRGDFGANDDATLTQVLADLLSRFPGDEYSGPKLLFVHKGRLFLSGFAGGHYHEQLACFVPGLMMLGAMMLPDRARSRDAEIAEKLLDGCLWTYSEPTLSQSGLGADFIELQDGENGEDDAVQLEHPDLATQSPNRQGDSGYLLRPETVESVFIAWRTTRNPKWRKAAWDIFTALKRLQVGSGGFYGIANVAMRANLTANYNIIDEQPSFFIAETLKYLFLTFDDPERLSLKDWVFNTECHPLPLPNNRKPRPTQTCGG